MLVVARLLDGTKVKGRTTDFHPEHDSFTIQDDPDPPVQIQVRDLKALFFVKSLDGDRDHTDHRVFPTGTGVRSKLWLQFRDGEEMAAWPVAPSLGKTGFYVLPTDADSNVEKAWVFRRSVSRILQDRDAERASRQFTLQSARDERESSATWPQVVHLS